ncbi:MULTISPECIES: hypothetical protein [unclassified Cupriavidus]|uniref:hypothetical protein n=1 Tax=unclassified Cupriavidus TaxID=2640874 RepID=UPI003F919A2E
MASASISLLHPLFEAGYLAPRLPISIHAVQGYSALEASETRSRAETAARAERAVFRTLQTTSIDRELREIKRWTRPPQAIQLATSIGNFARGTAVHIPLFQSNLTPHHTLEDAYSLLERWYLDSCHVRVTRGATPADGIAVGEVSDTNILELYCLPGSSEESGLLAARLDNLGRGSARAAIQALNIMLDRRADFALDGCLQPECR